MDINSLQNEPLGSHATCPLQYSSYSSMVVGSDVHFFTIGQADKSKNDEPILVVEGDIKK